jgi:hypothetical protein
MKRFWLFSLVCFFSGFMLLGCQRDEGVRAGNDSETYQPRPAPSKDAQDDKRQREEDREMKGELLRVDTAAKTVVIRLENGVVQTFKFDDATAVEGLQVQVTDAKKQSTKSKGVRGLVGKEGSEVTIQWAEDSGPKLATEIEVTELNTSKNTRRDGRR